MKFIDNIIKRKGGIIMYTSDTWDDCKEAKSYFADNQIDVIYKNISEKKNRNELIKKYNRMAVPTIIIENKIFLGFAENREEIARLLKKL